MKRPGQKVTPIDIRLQRGSITDPKSGCWEWQGTLRNGYGRMTIGSRTDGTRYTESTHRLSYELFVGEIPEGMEVCHKCDNRRCINPEHLFVGTRQDNVDDREAKGRNNPQRGTKHPKAKMTDYTVFISRVLYDKGHSMRRLAKRFGVDRTTIQNIIKRKAWTHVPPPPFQEK